MKRMAAWGNDEEAYRKWVQLTKILQPEIGSFIVTFSHRTVTFSKKGVTLLVITPDEWKNLTSAEIAEKIRNGDIV